MADAVSLDEAKLFLRVTTTAEDGLIALLIRAAQVRVEGELGLTLDGASAAPLRLAVLQIVAHAYEHREGGETAMPGLVPWLAAWRPVRL